MFCVKIFVISYGPLIIFCLFSQENERLCQIIEVREAKLVELSKENLNLQETNAILRR